MSMFKIADRSIRAALWAALVLAAASAATHARAEDDADTTAIKAVLATYQAACEKLDLTGVEILFDGGAQIFEQGGAEGTITTYLEHHLKPELGEFATFDFDDYAASVTVAGDFAYATETYTYRIVMKTGGDPIDRLGAATSVFKRIGGEWKIAQYHSSSRKPSA